MQNENLGSLLAKHYRPILIVSGIIVAICTIILAVVLIQQLQPEKTYISISVAPSQATVMINGNEYHNGSYEFQPGQYQATISAEGFTTKTLDINVQPDQTTAIATYLVNNQEKMEYFEKSTADLQVLSTLPDEDAQEFISNYDQKASIRDLLPIDATYDLSAESGMMGNDLYEQKITDGSSDSRCTQAFCLHATGYRLNMDALRQAVANLGYNFDDYEVIYDFEM